MKFAFQVMCASVLMLSLAACNGVPLEEPTILSYTKPELSGLSPIRPFPKPDSICQLLGKSENTSLLRIKGRALIACPKHEKGAIADRLYERARVVGNAKHWAILSVPSYQVK